MKAILVKYLPATNTKPSRLSARAEGVKSLIVSYDSQGGNPKRKAAQALCDRMGWTGALVSGGLPNGDTVFCFADSTD